MKRKIIILFVLLLFLVAIKMNAQWSITGNTGTNPAIHFIGTTDNVDLVFKRNQVLAGILSSANTSFGLKSLYGNTTGTYNTAIGGGALYSTTTGNSNTASGGNALFFNSGGSYNAAAGVQALYSNTTGACNTADGSYAFFDHTTGNYNVALGYNTGRGITTGSYNTIIGANVMGLPPNLNNTIILADGLGNQRLYINNVGNTGIGTNNPGNYKLNVWGSIRAHEIVVNTTGADFVFEENYRLRPLEEVAQFIWQNKYLPEIAPAAEMQKDGVSVAELQVKLLQKIEELTLYMIQQHDKSILQDKRIEELANENNILKTLITNLQKQ